MLNYSEALLLLRSARDMRCTTWERGGFVRMVRNPNGVPQLKRYRLNGTVESFVPTDAEQLTYAWEVA
jgi:hypothetical protein